MAKKPLTRQARRAGVANAKRQQRGEWTAFRELTEGELAGHEPSDRHETQHGCVFYDVKPATNEERGGR